MFGSTLRIAGSGELIGDHHARFIAEAVDKLPKETLGSVLITPRLQQDVQLNAVLIDRPPRVRKLAESWVETSQAKRL